MSDDTIVTGSITSIKKITGSIQRAQTVYRDDYNDLKNKPTINGVILKGNKTLYDLGITAENISNLAEVAKTGNYEDLINKPEIPVVEVDKIYVDTVLAEKVDKVSGMGLSSNDFTSEEKNKLAELENYDDASLKNNIAMNLSSIGMNKKNLLKNTGTSKTSNGITFTVNDDSSVSLSGTSTAATYFTINSNFSLKGDFILSGCPSGGGNTYRIEAKNTTEKIYKYDTGNGISFSNETSLKIEIYVASGINMDGKTFYPMIRYANVTDSTYEVYKDDLQTQINNLLARIEALNG